MVGELIYRARTEPIRMTEDFTRGREQLAGEDWWRIGTIVNEGDYLIN